MKFAHLADTHLGYKQYGSINRENDFYEVFEKIIDKIIEEDVDFVIHSGDLFETPKPSPNSLLVFQKGLLKLKGAGIPMYAIAGNHESLMRKGAIPPQVLFKKFGLKVISPINTNYLHDDVFIAGLPFYPNSQNKTLKEKLAQLSAKAENYDKSILVLHQGIDKYLPFQYELEIGDIPDNFDYYAFGHIHKYIEDSFGKGKLVYPGSTEILNSDENNNYKKDGKGFVVVDMDGPKPKVKKVNINLPREFISKEIDYQNLGRDIENIKDLIRNLDKKPIVKVTVYNIDGSVKDVYDYVNNELKDYALIVKTICKTVEDDFEPEFIENRNSLTPRELIVEKLSEYGNKNMTELAVKLFESLSLSNGEESEKLIANYYNDNFDEMVIDKSGNSSDLDDDKNENKTSDVKVTFKEAI